MNDLLFERGGDDALAAEKMFPNQGLHQAARMFGASHPRAIQYLEQAPVLVFGGQFKSRGVPRMNLLYLQHKLVPLCEAGAPLKTVLRTFDFAPPLRQIRASAIFPSALPVLSALSTMDPAVLGRIIPTKPGAQRNWLIALSEWRSHLRGRGRSPDTLFAWAAEAISLGKVAARRVSTVADFASEPDETFNAAWQWPRAEEEAELWHDRLSVERMVAKSPFKADTPIDLGKHPDSLDVEDMTFVALRTVAEIVHEGTAMRHCVASYANTVANGHCHIISVRRGSERIATLELSKAWAVTQLKGRFNATPPKLVHYAATEYARLARKAAGQ